jgi:hypothetical protein
LATSGTGAERLRSDRGRGKAQGYRNGWIGHGTHRLRSGWSGYFIPLGAAGKAVHPAFAAALALVRARRRIFNQTIRTTSEAAAREPSNTCVPAAE